jgi:hypothetical protein
VPDNQIFTSHASCDRPLADLVVNTLVLAGVPGQYFFYSSSRATGIPSGEDIRSYLHRALREAELVIELVSKEFLKRPMCLIEHGGAWALETPIYPIIIPPLSRHEAIQYLGDVQSGYLGNDADIDDLFDELHDRLAESVGIKTEVRRWNRAIREFKLRVGGSKL